MSPALGEGFVLLQGKATSTHGAHMEPVSSLWCWKVCFSLTVVPKKWDWHIDKHLSEKASFSFVTDFPFEGKLFLQCISQLRTIQHSLGKKIRQGKLQQCISRGSFVLTCFFCVYICLDFSHLQDAGRWTLCTILVLGITQRITLNFAVITYGVCPHHAPTVTCFYTLKNVYWFFLTP